MSLLPTWRRSRSRPAPMEISRYLTYEDCETIENLHFRLERFIGLALHTALDGSTEDTRRHDVLPDLLDVMLHDIRTVQTLLEKARSGS